MRIAFFVGTFPSLSAHFILNQMTGVIDRGHELDIFAAMPGPAHHAQPIVLDYGLLQRTFPLPNVFFRSKRIRHAVQPNGNPAATNLLKSLESSKSRSLVLQEIRQRPYDIIHCQFGVYGLRAVSWRALRMLPGKIVTSFRGYDATRIPREKRPGIYRPLFDRGDLFLPVSESIRDRLVRLGCDERKILVHRSGIDTTKFPFVERRPPKQGEIRLATVARLVPKKGLEYAIRAVARLARRRRDIRYEIIGRGPLKQTLKRIVRELDAEEYITLSGWKCHDDLSVLLGRAHILICPSVTAKSGDQEGIPNVLKEAMATGMPVVATRHGGIPELVTDGQNGFLVAEQDEVGLAERINHLIENPQVWSSLGRAARRTVEEQYDSNRLNDQLVDIYQDIAHSSCNKPALSRQARLI